MNSYLRNDPGAPEIDVEFMEQQKAEEELEKQQQETVKSEATASPEQPEQTKKPKTELPTGPDPEVVEQVKESEQEDEEDQSTIEVIAEGAAALPVGVTDFAVDFLNLVPGVEIPKVPEFCLLYTSPSPRDRTRSRMPSSA